MDRLSGLGLDVFLWHREQRKPLLSPWISTALLLLLGLRSVFKIDALSQSLFKKRGWKYAYCRHIAFVFVSAIWKGNNGTNQWFALFSNAAIRKLVVTIECRSIISRNSVVKYSYMIMQFIKIWNKLSQPQLVNEKHIQVRWTAFLWLIICTTWINIHELICSPLLSTVWVICNTFSSWLTLASTLTLSHNPIEPPAKNTHTHTHHPGWILIGCLSWFTLRFPA